jgi:hypothetical protein
MNECRIKLGIVILTEEGKYSKKTLFWRHANHHETKLDSPEIEVEPSR